MKSNILQSDTLITERKAVVSVLMVLASSRGFLMKKSLFFSLILSFVLSGVSNAKETQMDDIIISANKVKTDSSQVTNSVSIVTEEEINAKQPLLLVDILKNIPGIYTTQRDGFGGMNGISIRGAKTAYTQYRWNGIPLRDTADTQGNFSGFLGSFSLLPGTGTRLEVLKGSQGTLYGSSAIGGVISIYDDAKWDSGSNASIRLGGGSYGTGTVNGSVSYGNDKFYVNFNPQIMHTDGYNDVWQDQGGYKLSSGYKFSEDTSLEFFSLMTLANHANYDSPTVDGSGHYTPQKGLDDEYRSTKQFFSNGLVLTHNFSENWQTVAKAAYNRADRTFKSAPTAWGPSTVSKYRSDNYFADIYNDIRITDSTRLVAGMDYERQQAKIDSSYNMQDNVNNAFSAYGKLTQLFFDDAMAFNLGGRYVHYEDIGSDFTWDTGLSYTFFTKTRLYGNIATGFRAPSLYERYGDGGINAVASPDLDPETSVNYEIGVEQKLWDDKIIVTGALFRTDYKDRILGSYNSSYIYDYYNADEAKERGYELSVNVIPAEWLELNFSFTRVLAEEQDKNGNWTESKDMPDNIFLATVYVYPMQGLTLSATGHWESERECSYPKGYSDDSAFTLDLAATYDINEHFQVYAAVNNLLDEEYTVKAWEMPGINFMSGIQYTF